MHVASKTDIDEASMVGKSALKYAAEGNSGYMVCIKRENNIPYKSSTFLVKAKDVANKVKYFPTEWINAKGNFITEEGLKYLRPLIIDEPNLIIENFLPKYKVFSR